MISKLASAIYNDIVSGLVGITANPTLSMDQLQDDVVDEWLQIIKEYAAKNLVPRKDLLLAINCLEVDKQSLDQCKIPGNNEVPIWHFQVPQIVNDSIDDTVEFVGTTDKDVQYKVYLDTSWQYHRYLRRGSERVFVYIQTTPNQSNLYDGWIFNIDPLVELSTISIIAIFKDPRQLEVFPCCGDTLELENRSFIAAEIKKRLTEKKIRYYRQLYMGQTPNTQTPK